MNLPTNSPAWTALGWTFLHMLWAGAAVGLAASLLRRSMRRSSPEARHGAALMCLLILAAAPFAAFALVYEPGREVVAPPSAAAALAAKPHLEAGGAVAFDFAPIPPGREAVGARPQISTWFEPWISALPAVWLAGSTLTLAWLAAGLAGVGSLRRSGLVLESGPVAGRCRELAASLGIARRVVVAACDRVAAPVLIGVIRPMILLPTAALAGWPPEHVEMALLHELAHLRRRDNLACLFQKLVEALLFFHPTTWWLSAWLRLERESCCDRLVVARTDRPRAYAELLAALADARPAPALAPALAERPLATRIRRILLKEDRPMTMKPTAPEALALAAATLLAAALVLPTRAEPPADKADAAKAKNLAELERLAQVVAASPPAPPRAAGAQIEPDDRISSLIAIAEKQARQGDRAGALRTLGHVRIEPPVGKNIWKDFPACLDAYYLTSTAGIRHDAGDVAGARATFRQVADALCRPDPAADADALPLVGRMFDVIARKVPSDPDGAPVAVDFKAQDSEVKKAGGGSQDEPEIDPSIDPEVAMSKLMALEHLARELASRHEVETLRRVADYAVGMIEPLGNTTLTSAMCADFGGQLVLAGDAEAGMAMIGRGRSLVDGLPPGEARDGALTLHALQAAEGDLDGTLRSLASIPSTSRNVALRRILENMCTANYEVNWLDSGGVKVTIGEPGLSPKASARAALPKFAAVAATVEDAATRARTLAVIAHLMARAGDFDAAMRTAGSIPDADRGDRPGPAGGFYESVRPATFALIAGRYAKAGDRSGADAAFARSAELANAVGPEAERLVAWIVLAENLEAAGRPDRAKAVLADAIPLAATQPEPRRSRMLGALSAVQLDIAGVDAAMSTIDLIRDDRGVEKGCALDRVAHHLDKKGDHAAARDAARRALAALRPRANDPSLKDIPPGPMTRNGFIDYDRETPTPILSIYRSNMQPTLRKIAGEPAPDLASLQPHERQMARASAVNSAYRSGGLDEALKVVEAIDTPEGRANALANLAHQVAGPVVGE